MVTLSPCDGTTVGDFIKAVNVFIYKGGSVITTAEPFITTVNGFRRKGIKVITTAMPFSSTVIVNSRKAHAFYKRKRGLL